MTDCNLQWLFHIQYFHYFSKMHVREFTAYCIQTDETFTWHVKLSYAYVTTMSDLERVTYKIQSERIGLHWSDGVGEDEFLKQLKSRVGPMCDIFVLSPSIAKYFENVGYTNVEVLKIIPKNLPTAPITCHMHSLSSKHCTQRTLAEVVTYLRPAFVPYLETSIIKSPVQYHDEAAKYGEHSLSPPFYRSIKTVDLLKLNHHHHADCEYSMEGGIGTSMHIE